MNVDADVAPTLSQEGPERERHATWAAADVENRHAVAQQVELLELVDSLTGGGLERGQRPGVPP